MRFKFFGSKGSMDTTTNVNKKKKEKKKPKEETAIVCTGYRSYNEFDTPSRLRTIPQLTIDDQASSSYTSIPNGNISKPDNVKTYQSDTSTKIDNPPIIPKKGILTRPKSVEAPKPKLELPKETKKDSNPQQNATKGSIAQQNATANIPASPEVVLRRKPNFNESLNNYYEHDDNQISIIEGKVDKSKSDDGKKSALIHMTESHDDRSTYNDDDDYDEIGAYSGAYGNNTKSIDSAVMRNEYSSEAASIFFNSAGDEPPVERKRNIKYKDDDDDDQTSA